MPPWINRLAYLTTFVPFIERIIPKEWISPLAVQQTVENQLQNNNTGSNNRPASASNSTNNATIGRPASASSIFKSFEKLMPK
jgi:hypothetical protein